MNTILQKRIEEKSKELGQMFFPDNMNVFARPNWEAGYIETACKEIANFALQNQWISVEEALPEKEQYVLVAVLDTIKNEYNYGFDAVTDSTEVVTDEHGFRIWVDTDRITHWIPIPELPKGGEK
jgi:hypothetical protein